MPTGRARASMMSQPSPRLPQWTTGSSPRARPASDRSRRHVARERAAADDAPVLHDQRAVVDDERKPLAQLVGDAARGGVAAPGHERDANAERAGPRDRLAAARRERAVAAEQRAVDVEGHETDARGGHRSYSPVHSVTRSITSPGRIRSTTSIPATTWPKSV